jgi:hypothetical protein
MTAIDSEPTETDEPKETDTNKSSETGSTEKITDDNASNAGDKNGCGVAINITPVMIVILVSVGAYLIPKKKNLR